MMEPFSLLLCGALFLLAVMLLLPSSEKKKNKKQFVQTIEQFPGPPKYPIIGTMLPFLLSGRSGFFNEIQNINRSFKSMYRTWNGPLAEIHITSPDHVETILRSSEHLDKSFIYELLHPWLGTGLLTSTGQKWHTHRKMITPTFHFKILDSFVDVFSEKSEILVQKLKREVGSPEFDMYPYITKCALDIICETAMGTPVFAQEAKGSEYVKAVYDMSEITTFRLIRPWLRPDFIFRLTSEGRRNAECLRMLHGFTNKVITERKAQLLSGSDQAPAEEDVDVGKKTRKAFLDLMLETSLDGVKLTDEELREEVDTFMFEGHDTTSAGMSWALFLLGAYPDVQEKVYQEQDSIFQGSDRSPTMKDLSEMKYLEQVLKESLRLYPSVAFIGRKLNKDCKIGDRVIPAGCTVILHIYHVHRNPEQFPDPEKFDPDNFLPERVAKRHPYAYIPFSAGPRNCIGQKFALLEEKTVLSYILRHYEVRSLEKREDINLMGELIVRPENGIKLSITPRKSGRGQ